MSKSIIAIVVILIILVAGVAAYYASVSSRGTSSTTSSTSSTSSSSTSSSSTSSTTSVPSSFTYETVYTYSYLDPTVSYCGCDWDTFTNVYEPLVWYNGSSSSLLIPWLASSYTVSPDLSTYNFTLRQGIKFADGEPFNSSAVYFSYNRFLILDGSSPTTHGTQPAWIIQQLLNTSLSTAMSGTSQAYDAKWVNSVLAENFVQITGPYTFTLHVQHPDSAFLYEIAGIYMAIMAPGYVMQHDLNLWSQPSTSYSLPYPTLSGNVTHQIDQYFMDEAATCNSGITPTGCATTYLDNSFSGSLAGTGPYTIFSVDKSTGNRVLHANPNYWGGPYASKIQPKIPVININFVPDLATRELDLQSAASAGRAMSIDLPNSNLYDIANRQDWLQNGKLTSIIPGVSIYGPDVTLDTMYEAFALNVTNALTGSYYKFQPFADQRLRLAFADSVNVSQSVIVYNNGISEVALNSIPPALPPQGLYNASIKPIFSYNPVEVQNLLLDAMEHPITSFNFKNGTLAPQGFFNNTFGCTTLTNGRCSNPVPQTMTLVYGTGDTMDEGVLSQIASVVNNVSATYNMGLTVTLTPLPSGQQMTSEAVDSLYMYGADWGADYPWALDFMFPFYAPSGYYTSISGWNIPYLGQLYQQAATASAQGNISALIQISHALDTWGNQHVMYLWTDYFSFVYVMTSNVHGYYFNPSNYLGAQEPYWALLY